MSALIHLEAGQRYYIEALMKADHCCDHLSVTWQLPGAPPPANGDPPIPGAYLAYEASYSPEDLAFQFTQQPKCDTAGKSNRNLHGGDDFDLAELVFQWQRNSVDIPGANGRSYTTPLLTLGDSGARFPLRRLTWPVQQSSAEAVLTVTRDTEPPRLQPRPE